MGGKEATLSGRDAGIAVRDLSLPSDGRWAVRGLTFAARAGTLHLILGERDTGKTALLDTIAGLRAPSKGAVLVAGDGSAPAARRRALALIPRETPIRQLRVLERLLLHDTPRAAKVGIQWKQGREEARARAARVGLEALLEVP
jgi:ABC-type cobalamin/Fe3+-siderophores transport system ATPase subunit